jgi:hypothetical protein
LATGGAHVPTSVPLASVLGHILRAGGLGFICWRLMKFANCVNAKTGKLSDEFASRHRIFWKTGAWTLSLLAAYAVFEIAYPPPRDPYGFFRPEFESGFVLVGPHRIEFRRGSEEPVKGWMRRKVRDSERALFVSPTTELGGNDIRLAMVRIAEIFPGNQTVQLHIQFTDEGAKKMAECTKGHLTKPLAVFIDGELRAAPHMFSPISGDAQLSNLFTLEEAARMILKGSDR